MCPGIMMTRIMVLIMTRGRRFLPVHGTIPEQCIYISWFPTARPRWEKPSQ